MIEGNERPVRDDTANALRARRILANDQVLHSSGLTVSSVR